MNSSSGLTCYYLQTVHFDTKLQLIRALKTVNGYFLVCHNYHFTLKLYFKIQHISLTDSGVS